MGKVIKFPNKKPANKERTIQDVFDTFTDEQKEVVYFMIGSAIEDTKARMR